ncbi:hypothetical protein SPRG_04738 [Saprolegnia parasitica CBS 223.65]|uniref:Autophagy-related protein 16 domain-containing protein n=1 Tax=Saprolegnia parasitica (strain CBS 223.65) TaxID=695850 RepID=A0A067CVL1_SAPPC|nr:hypothetical protein SPRG_04738 [Saprolegnia parasitica CBS 223.65]KDO30837.1 hypothetical protein SPRG_04738 [Saprolegnia parasitica CBS 223.65]|eukprot:XP_012198534.1 hypothetical protein SPRG_04738 [Saprolegnia parasitica CBS 223.65]
MTFSETKDASSRRQSRVSVDSFTNDSGLVAFLSQQLETAQSQLLDLERDFNVKTARQDVMREQLENQAMTLQDVNQELTNELLKLRATHSSALPTSAACETANTELRDEITRLRADCEAMDAQHTRTLDALKHELGALTDENASLVARNYALESHIAGLKAPVASQSPANEPLKGLEKKLDEARITNLGLAERNVALNDQAVRLEMELRDALARSQRLVDVEKQNQTLQQLLCEARDETEELQSVSDAMRKENTFLLDQNTELMHDVRVLSSAVDDLKLAQMRETTASDTTPTEQHQKDVHADQIAMLETALAENDAKITALRDLNQDTLAELETKLTHIQTLETQLVERPSSSSPDDRVHLVQENARLRTVVEELEADLGQRTTELARMERSLASIRAAPSQAELAAVHALEVMKQRETRLQEEVHRLTAKVDAMAVERDDLVRSINDSERWSVQMRDEMKRMDTQFEQVMTHRTQDLQRQHDSLTDALAREKAIVAQLRDQVAKIPAESPELDELRAVHHTLRNMIVDIAEHVAVDCPRRASQDPNELVAALSGLRHHVWSLEQHKAASTAETQGLRDATTRVNDELAAMRQELTKAHTAEAHLKRQLTTAEQALRAKMTELRQSANKVEILEAELVARTDAGEASRRDIKKLKSQVQDLQDEHERCALRVIDLLSLLGVAATNPQQLHISKALDHATRRVAAILRSANEKLQGTATAHENERDSLSAQLRAATERGLQLETDVTAFLTALFRTFGREYDATPSTPDGNDHRARVVGPAPGDTGRKIERMNEHMTQMFHECLVLQRMNESYAHEVAHLRAREKHLEHDLVSVLGNSNRRVPETR